MKMKPIIETGWNLQNMVKRESAEMGPMIGIGTYFCCAC